MRRDELCGRFGVLRAWQLELLNNGFQNVEKRARERERKKAFCLFRSLQNDALNVNRIHISTHDYVAKWYRSRSVKLCSLCNNFLFSLFFFRLQTSCCWIFHESFFPAKLSLLVFTALASFPFCEMKLPHIQRGCAALLTSRDDKLKHLCARFVGRISRKTIVWCSQVTCSASKLE